MNFSATWPEVCLKPNVVGTPVGVILDVDGTLVDSNDAHARAWFEVLSEAGYDVSLERLRRMIGIGGDKMLAAAIRVAKDSPEGKRLSKLRDGVFKAKYLPHLRPTPGARALLAHFRAHGHPLVVASSAAKDELRGLLKAADVADLVESSTTSSDVDESKPDPDIVDVALEKLGRPPGEAIMLGDTPYDIEAATRAGVATIAVRCGGWDDAGLPGALAIYDDPRDVLTHYEQLPLASAATR